MHVCSVQSKIFNEIVKEALAQDLDLTQKGQQTVPLMGYKTKFSQGPLGKIEQKILKQNGLQLPEFDIKEIPHLRIKGSFRNAIVPIKNLDIEIESDNLNKPAKKNHPRILTPKRRLRNNLSRKLLPPRMILVLRFFSQFF